jgi:hypothetical protein
VSVKGTGGDRKRDKEGKSGTVFLISDYFREVERRIKDAEIVADKSIDFREFSTMEGMLRGRLLFVDGSMLEFMEYLHKEKRLKYRFHMIDREGEVVFRYDNAPHHDIATFPHHKHLPNCHSRIKRKGTVGSVK